jgi:hypothetical protein
LQQGRNKLIYIFIEITFKKKEEEEEGNKKKDFLTY